MKQHLYISSFLLILFVSLVCLNVYSGNCTGKDSDKQYLQSQQFTSGKWSLEDATGEDPCAFVVQSGKISLPEKTPDQKDLNLLVSSPYIFLSNPLLFDLPPPAPQS
ncbi:MAG: hypothetical protein AMS26_05475 [Bacteroides sp. SM23_62]|nr:MAG: hypothetical protein AMS26_05475 [Bacteroides sp. SM23_62]